MRTVVQSEEVSAFVDRAAEEYSHFEDLWSGLEWLLAHDPLAGEFAQEPGWYAIRTPDWSIEGVPEVVVGYRFTDEDVFLEFAFYAK